MCNRKPVVKTIHMGATHTRTTISNPKRREAPGWLRLLGGVLFTTGYLALFWFVFVMMPA